MSDAVMMDFEEPQEPRHAPRGGAKARDGKPSAWDDEKPPQKAVIPRLPEPETPLTGDEVRRGVSERHRSAAKLKVKGYTYQEIADILDFPSPQHARRAVESTLAATLAPEEIETQRMIVIARAEELFKQSAAMGHADFLVDDEGNKVANERKLAWHAQASTDLMNLAVLTGAKAPTRVEITPGEAEMERLVELLVKRSGHEDIVDAEVLEFDDIPQLTMGPRGDDEEYRG